MDERSEAKSFTFYRSYFEAAKDLPSKEEQADFLMSVCSYIFEGQEPNIQGVASAMFKLAKPNLDISIKRAKAGAIGGSNKQGEHKEESNDNQNASKTEATDKQAEIKCEAIKELGIRNKELGDIEREKVEKEKVQKVMEAWNGLPLVNISAIRGKRLESLRAREKEYSLDDVLKAVHGIRDCPFLLGQNKSNWQIDFDWFIRPNNFPKVLEGKYKEKKDGANFGDVGSVPKEYGDVL